MTAVQDTIDEPDETVLITASHDGSTIGPETVTITDDDAAPTLSVMVSADTVAEAAGTSTVTVSASGTTFATVQTIMLNLDGTATQTDDYTISAESLTLAAGDTSVTATVTAVQDTIDEVDETVLITASLGGSDIGTTFATAQTIALALAGTATKGDDYTIGAESLTLAAGATSVTATVMAVQDTIDEVDETVLITASLVGSDIGTQQTVTITDDDAAPTLTVSVSADTIGEAGGTSTVIISTGAGPAFGSDQTITLALAGTATEGTDYTIDSKMLTLAANTTSVSATITATADSDDDNDETIMITASHDSTTVGTQQTVTISETAPALSVTVSPAAIAEAAGTSTLTVSASSAFGSNQTIVLALSGTATKVDDYTIGAESLTLTAGQTSVTTTVTALDNDADAPDKTVTVSGAVSLEGVAAPAAVTLTIADDDEPAVMPPPVERGVEIVPTVLTIGEGDGAGGTYTARLVAEPTADVTVTVSVPSGAGLTVSPTSLSFTADNWGTARTVTVTAGIDDDADDRTVTLAHSASGGGYGDVTVADVSVTITDLVDPMLPAVHIADARGREAGGQLVFEVTLSGVAGRTVSVEYAIIEGTARAGEDYEAITGTATIAAGGTDTRIVVPLLVDVISEPDETFTVTLGGADGARLADTSATGTIEDPAGDGAAPQQWLGRFGRIAGRSLFGDAGAGSADLDQLFGRGGFGAAPPDGLRNATPLSPTSRHWRTQPGARPRGGNGGLAGAGSGGVGHGGPAATGSSHRASGGDAMNLREVLANSAFLLSAGSGGGGFAVWGRGAYTRFDNLGGGLETGGDAVTATLGVDWSCARCVFGVAVSQTRVDATYGAGGGESGDLESTITGLYPYFGARLTERLSVWGLVGQGEGELLSTPANGATVKVDLESRLAGLGARGDLLVSDSGFTLALKTDALVARTTTDEAEGLLEAEGEYRRLRLGLEGSWLRRFGEDASLRTSLEVAAREDAGDDLEGLGVEVRGGLEFIDVLPGLSLDVEVHGLVSHDAGDTDEYEEWGVSGGFRYDPRPETAAGPLVSLVHSWSPADSVGLGQALWRNDPARRGPAGASTGRGQENLSAEFAWGFDTFGALSVPWARMGASGAGRELRVGYSLLTGRGIPSLEFGESAFGREYALGWEFSLRCRIQVAVRMTHGTGLPGDRSDTGLRIGFRSIMPRRASGGSPGGASCGMAQPLFQSGASSLGPALP